jgi:predicted amidohydrolase YtcJ
MTRTIVTFLLAVCGAAAADTIYVNANVLTMDVSKPHAEAFAVDNGRFTAVGSNLRSSPFRRT